MDIRELDRRALDTLDKLVATVRPADLGRRTPCDGWDLGDLLRHQVSENRGFGTALREGSAPDWDSGALGDDPYRSYAESVEGVLAAFDDDEVLTRPVTVREFGTFPGRVALGMHLVDSVAHGWDVARCLDLPYDPDPEAVRAALAIAERIPADPEFRRERGTFAPVVELSPAAPELDRFLALLGRSPDWS
ncbi:TIGR03086 family metal-binding protein [Amycolatopsis cynarae]|uniref:TIGR03086 family metal-binding protein n=1 Tax=Amycolatopsis cynarae TaxID=2995223 RepID=A0ABY7B522_9PSEU|nr:TIGR03086 family metal-binding protein [Amycolatopsis sp. HUAS 11-8]WAL67427.1 TIGR03086 family metal-binding protein [Amycolatopsis sp. HUAS 11-8]